MVAEYDGYKINMYEGEITPEIIEKRNAAIKNAAERLSKLKIIYNERRNCLMEELAMRFTGFDFESAMNEIQRWQDELTTDSDDEIKYTVLEGIKDLIIDNCTFE